MREGVDLLILSPFADIESLPSSSGLVCLAAQTVVVSTPLGKSGKWAFPLLKQHHQDYFYIHLHEMQA